MKYRTKDERIADWRICGTALSLFAVFVLALFTACAKVPVDEMYVAPRTDSLWVHIENHRTLDASDPRIILHGNGTLDLGTISGMGGRIDRMISVRRLGPSGCVTVKAHYVGLGDLTFYEACWRPGESLYVALDNIFSAGASWFHR